MASTTATSANTSTRRSERISLTGLARVGVCVADPDSPPRVLRDPNDDYLVAIAKDSGATTIVTGARDLLDHDGLNPPTITPRQACVRLGVIPA